MRSRTIQYNTIQYNTIPYKVIIDAIAMGIRVCLLIKPVDANIYSLAKGGAKSLESRSPPTPSIGPDNSKSLHRSGLNALIAKLHSPCGSAELP